MVKRMLIDAAHPEESRVVVINGTRLEELDVETSTKKQLKGNIYLAKVTRVEQSLQAAFVEFGGNRHGFLAFSEIHPDYYQIPQEDRDALKRAGRPDQGEGEEKAEGEERGRRRRRARRPRREAQDTRTGEETSEETSVAESAEQTAPEQSAGPVAEEQPPAPLWGGGATAAEVPEATEATGSPSDTKAGEDGPNGHGGSIAMSGDTPEISVDPSEQAQPAILPQDADEEDDAPYDRFGEAPDSPAEIEDIGGDDTDEIGPALRPVPQKRYKIQEVIKRRQIMLVQVVKEERGNKGAALSTYLSLAGRYGVLMPNTPRGGGISRKIASVKDRKRLKSILAEMDIPDGMAVIVRTAGAERTKTEIKRDCDYLMRLWDLIRETTLRSTAPCLIYEEANLIKRSIRDLYSRNIDEVLVEGDDGYRIAKDFMKMLMPSHAKRVQPYRDNGVPMFQRYQIESQLDALHNPEVQLKSGGYIVINPTEALVAIDVNSGKATKERNIEETALRTNVEAAEEVARQLRLRDLAGLVVIDFIDMEETRNQITVERRLKDAMRFDRARLQIGRISAFGLLELSRQRLRPSIMESSHLVCPHCQGTGLVRSTESSALYILRIIEEEAAKRRSAAVTVTVNTEIALYVLNHKRDRLLEIENRFGLAILLEGDGALVPMEHRIERTRTDTSPARQVEEEAIVSVGSVLADIDDYEDEEEDEPDLSDSRDRDDREEEERGRGRSRRRRRRRGRQEEEVTDTSAPASDAEGPDSDDDALDAEDEEDEDGAIRRRRRRGKRGGRRRGRREERLFSDRRRRPEYARADRIRRDRNHTAPSPACAADGEEIPETAEPGDDSAPTIRAARRRRAMAPDPNRAERQARRQQREEEHREGHKAQKDRNRRGGRKERERNRRDRNASAVTTTDIPIQPAPPLSEPTESVPVGQTAVPAAAIAEETTPPAVAEPGVPAEETTPLWGTPSKTEVEIAAAPEAATPERTDEAGSNVAREEPPRPPAAFGAGAGSRIPDDPASASREKRGGWWAK